MTADEDAATDQLAMVMAANAGSNLLRGGTWNGMPEHVQEAWRARARHLLPVIYAQGAEARPQEDE